MFNLDMLHHIRRIAAIAAVTIAVGLAARTTSAFAVAPPPARDPLIARHHDPPPASPLAAVLACHQDAPPASPRVLDMRAPRPGRAQGSRTARTRWGAAPTAPARRGASSHVHSRRRGRSRVT